MVSGNEKINGSVRKPHQNASVENSPLDTFIIHTHINTCIYMDDKKIFPRLFDCSIQTARKLAILCYNQNKKEPKEY